MPRFGRSPQRRGATFRLLVLATVLAISSLTLMLASPASPAPRGTVDGQSIAVDLLGRPIGLADVDARAGSVQPTAGQLAAVDALGASARWNRFGTVQSLIRYGGFLATGLSADAIVAAKDFVSTNRVLFRLSDSGLQNLEVLNDSTLTGSAAHVVLLRQRFGDLPSANDGLIAVGVSGGKVAYVSSSAAGDGPAPGAATLSPQDAWLAAAADAGLNVDAGAISNVHTEDDWTAFSVAGFTLPQRARLRALPTPNGGVQAVYETIVVDSQAGSATAYTSFVDARTAKVWIRHNDVDQFAAPQTPQTGVFQGTTGGPSDPCGPHHEFDVPAGTKSIDVVASAVNPADDIVLNLIDPTDTTVASADTATSPEAIHYAPAVILPGTYAAEVCQFDPAADGFDYGGFFAVNDTIGVTYPYPPEWRYFQTSPKLDYSNTDSRVLGCWEATVNGVPVPGCDLALKNLAARGPWDYDFRANQPTFTTVGNAAKTAQAWTSPLTPGDGYRPVSPTRQYDFAWTNQWFDSKCDPSVFVSPARNDIDAAITNLFSGHNRMHDWAYFLGFTEQNYNLQDDNFGNTPPGPYPAGRENDPELGDVQAGAVDGGAPSYLGRDNANQITLNDGIPGITNQYLFQPIAGAFYSPCVDGDLDATVFAHEYTHAISNRMVGGPDSGLSGYQAGSMGESWSDLDAMEYLHEYGLVPLGGESPWAVGPYATGNPTVGIRDYAIDNDPLNYSDLGFDITGPEVHADGEVWNAVNYDIRRSLVQKYNAQFPESNSALQKRCADGVLPANRCPGNRRWIQIVYDAWLMMQPAVSMLDARDAYLAADVMRFGGANQANLWQAFARRGMGELASSNTNADSDPIPSFESPLSSEATVKFDAVAANEGKAHVNAQIFVGKYEARVTPVADTDPSTPLGDTVKFVPGAYDFVIQADGYGAHRFSRTLTAAPTLKLVTSLATNWASSAKGATATGDGTDQANLIDDTEGTNWTATSATSIQGSKITAHLAARHTIRFVNVSALLGPGQNRFTALRQFDILACDSTTADCSQDANFHKILGSPVDAFPGGIPRPLAPNLIMRLFAVPATAATDVRLVVKQNQCTGQPAYQGEQDNDPANATDCPSASTRGQTVIAAELQAFSTNCTLGGKLEAMKP
jgi:extracellular elastinolytic metalloproteinase